MLVLNVKICCLNTGCSRQHSSVGAGDEEQPGPARGAWCPAQPHHGQPELLTGYNFHSNKSATARILLSFETRGEVISIFVALSFPHLSAWK